MNIVSFLTKIFKPIMDFEKVEYNKSRLSKKENKPILLFF